MSWGGHLLSKREEVREYKRKIECMLNDEQFTFAYETLADILRFVVGNDHITDKQKQAIDNIEDSIEYSYGREEF